MQLKTVAQEAPFVFVFKNVSRNMEHAKQTLLQQILDTKEPFSTVTYPGFSTDVNAAGTIFNTSFYHRLSKESGLYKERTPQGTK